MPSDNLSSLFQRINGSEGALRLLNLYKGLPINDDATVLEVGPGALCVRANKYQIVCLYIERETFLQSRVLPVPVRARLLQLSAVHQQAILGDFRAVDEGIGDRQQIRVEPAEILTATLQPRGQHGEAQAQIANLSQNGAGLYMSRSMFNARAHVPQAEFLLRFTLPESPPVHTGSTAPLPADPMERFSRSQLRGTSSLNPERLAPPSAGRLSAAGIPRKIQVRGVLRNVRPELNQGRVRLGMQLFPDEAARAALLQYVSQRQSEIIREVKGMYDTLVRLEKK